MLFPAGKSWVLDFFIRRGWLVERRRKTRRRPGGWNLASTVPAECLETRILLSTITVTNTLDSGAGSLRDAIANASSGDTIAFDSSTNGTPIELTSGELGISSSLTITGNGATNTLIDAQQNSRIFNITSGAGDVILDGLTLENGTTGQYGGAIYNGSTGTVTITSSTLSGSSVNGLHAFGGAIFNVNGKFFVQNSTITGNSTSGTQNEGGAIYNRNGTLSITNSTLTGNTAGGYGAYGGAVYSYHGSVIVTNDTIAKNYAPHGTGGGIAVRTGSLTVRNTVLARNTDQGTAPDLYAGPLATVVLTHSLIGDNTGTGLTAAPVGSPDANGNLIGTSSTKIDPLLGALAFNGGPTETMALGTGSPALDAGSNAAATDPGPDGIPGNGDDTPLTIDQRGAPFARNAGVAVDIGAYEAQALSLVVTSTADTLDAVYNAAQLTLRDAVALANANPGADTITFDSTVNGTPIDLSLGELEISGDVTITGNGAANTTIDAQSHSRVLQVDGGVTVSLLGVTLTGGSATGTGIGRIGGGVLNQGALTISDSIITGNAAGDRGGGIGSYQATSLSLIDCTISNNTAATAAGIYNYGSGTFSATNCTITGNNASNYGGGLAGSVLTESLVDCTIDGNTALRGGGIFATDGTWSIEGSTISNNTASLFGGGIEGHSAALVVVNSTVSGNTAAEGGGFFFPFLFGSGINSTLTDVTISNNRATGGAADGGGMFVQPDSSPFVAQLVTLQNTIVAGNFGGATGTAAADVFGPLVSSSSFNLIGDGTNMTGISNGSNGNQVGTSGSPIDAHLGTLADNGGPTQTMALLAGSPAIDAGSAAVAIDPSTSDPLVNDQRGFPFPRNVGLNVDIGAYEVPPSLIVTSADDTLDAVYNAAHFTLRDALALANADPGADTITFDPAINGTTIVLALGQFVISDPVTITGNGAANTIINAHQSSRLFSITSAAGDVTLDGLTLENGKTTAASASGGAIKDLSTGTLSILNSTVTGNSTVGDFATGGAISDNRGSVAITNSTISNNSTAGYYGYGGAIGSEFGYVTITDSTVSGNFTTGAQAGGGAIAAYTLTVTGSTFSANYTYDDYARGGAITALHDVTITSSTFTANFTNGIHSTGGAVDVVLGDLAVTSSTLSGNFTQGRLSDGGAIYDDYGSVTVTDSTLSGNYTTQTRARGGAISSGGTTVTVINSTLSGNSTAGSRAIGGAIAAAYDVIVTNSTITGNSTSGNQAVGGAIYSYKGAVTVIDSTIARNYATSAAGGGIYTYAASAAVTLTNSILALNTDDGTAPDLYAASGAAVTITTSLIGDNTGTTLVAAPVGSPDLNGNLIGTGVAPIDPLLGTLANNGGPTETLALLTGSPAVGAGVIVKDIHNVSITVDQRGNTRHVGAVDIGAYQSPISPPVFTSANSTIFAAGLAGSFTVVASSLPAATLTESNTDVLPGNVTFNHTTGVLSGTPLAGTNGIYVLHFTASNGLSADTHQTFTLYVTSPFSFAGEYGVTGGSSTLASITQSGSALSLNGASTTVGATITDGMHILVNGTDTATYENSSIVFTAGTFAGQTWTKLNLPSDYTNQQGTATHVIQNGSSVTFVNKFGAASPGVWMSPTQLFITNWHETVSILIGRLLFQDGSIWSENLNITGNKNGSGTTTVRAFPGEVDVIDYVNQSGRPVHLVVNGTTNVVFIDANSHMSLGTFNSSTQASTPFFPGDIATFSNDLSRVSWTDGTIWTQTVPNSAVTVTNYTNQNGVAVHLVQNGTNQLTFVDSVGRLSLGTMQSPTTALADAYPGDLATFSGNTVHWQDGFVWTKTDTAGVSPIVVTDYTNGSGKPVHLIENGTSNVIFVDATSHMSLGTFINSTHASTPYYPNDVATIASDLSTVTWQDGSVWTRTTLTTAITVTSYTNGSGAPVYVIQNGTTQLAFVDRLNRMSLGTMRTPTTALADLYPGDLATFSGNFIQWQDGTLWTRTTVSPLTVSFVDTNGALSHVRATTPTTLLGLDGPLQGVTGTRVNNQIEWSNGDVWANFDFDALHALFQMATGYP